MIFHQAKKEALSLSIAPLIDVIFLLLIFFIVTHQFNAQTRLAVALPQVESQEVITPAKDVIEVQITQGGQYRVNGAPAANADAKALIKAMTLAKPYDPQRKVVIAADGQVAYQSVITAMDAALQLGYTQIELNTQLKGRNQP